MIDYPKFSPLDDDIELADRALSHALTTSESKLVDYGDSSPLAVLVQAQAYAGGILLRRINEVYKRIAWEILSLARLTPIVATSSRVVLTVRLTGTRPIPWVLPIGTEIRCQQTEELWTTATELVIDPDSIQGTVVAVGPLGSRSNIRPNLVWSTILAYAFIDSISNDQAGYGGTDQETEAEFLNRSAYVLGSRKSIITVVDYEFVVSDSLGKGVRSVAIPSLSLDTRSEELGSVHVFVCGSANSILPQTALKETESKLSDRILLGSRIYVSNCEQVAIDLEVVVNAPTDVASDIVSVLRSVVDSIPLKRAEVRTEDYSRAIWQDPSLSKIVSSIYSINLNGEGAPVILPKEWSVPVNRSIYVEVVAGSVSYKTTWVNPEYV
jgi:hypothetical protein